MPSFRRLGRRKLPRNDLGVIVSKSPSYWDYLKLDQLLNLQNGLDADESQISSDELHFIVVHQVYELWFKLILRELRLARDHLAAPKVDEVIVPHVVHHLRRVSEIFKLTVQQWAVVETLTPQDFLAFRDKLAPASGFQSYQMRELEFVLGRGSKERVRYGDIDPVEHIRQKGPGSKAGEKAVQHLAAAEQERSLRSVLHDWLYRTPIQASSPADPGDEAIVREFLDAYLAAHERLQRSQLEGLLQHGISDRATLEHRFAASNRQSQAFLHADDVAAPERTRERRVRAALLFIESYRALPLLSWPRLLVDAVVEVEEQFVLWRNRHARMTERTIGRRVGTGGSSGVDYLDKAAEGRIFPELWAVRTVLLPADALPQLRNPGFYGFAV
jgi:tryptophan 2,3-dioxygenase